MLISQFFWSATESPGSSFLALATILHGVARATRHQFVPVAIRGSCLVDDEDQWLSDPGYQVERALFGGIVRLSFAGSPTDPNLPENFSFYFIHQRRRLVYDR